MRIIAPPVLAPNLIANVGILSDHCPLAPVVAANVGMREEMARLAVARKLWATVLAVWKSGENFDAGRILRKAV